RQARGRPERRLRDHDGMVRIQRLELLVRAHQAGGGNGTGSVWIRRLVDALVDAERGGILETARDLREQLLVRRVRRRGQVRDLAELQPAAEPFRRCGVEDGLDLRDLRVDLAEIPLHELRADEVDARALDLVPAVRPAGRRAPERRWIRERDRKHLRAVDDETARGLVDADGRQDLPGWCGGA